MSKPVTRPVHRGLRHVALVARDLPAMKRFYVDMMGFEVEWEPDPDNVYLSSGVDNLALHKAEPGKALPEGDRRASPLDHIGVIVSTADDVDRWAGFLESRGVALSAKPRTHRDGARSCYLKDPDGNTLQIIFHPPISGKL